MAQRLRDLTIVLPVDRPGTLADALEILSRAGLALDGHAEIEGVLHVLTSSTLPVDAALGNVGCRVAADAPALVLEQAEWRGKAGPLLRRLADAGLNVTFLYLAMHNRLVLGSPALEEVEILLGQSAAAEDAA